MEQAAFGVDGVQSREDWREAIVHATDRGTPMPAAVWESVAWWYRELAQFNIEWEFPNLPPEEQAMAFPLRKPLQQGNIPIDAFDSSDMIVIGDTDACVRKMKHYADLGIDQLICYVQWGYLEHGSIMRTIEILGREVIPELEAYRASYPPAMVIRRAVSASSSSSKASR